MKYFALIWANLKRRKLRTLLTLLSIFVAFLIYGLLCTVNESFTGAIALAGADRLIVRHKVSLIMTLPASYKTRMERIPGVSSAVHFTWFNGIYRNEPKDFFANMPTEPEPFLALYTEFLLPPEQQQAWIKTRTGAIAGRALADRFKWKIGDRIMLKSPLWPREGDEAWEFEIVGIFEGAKKGTDTSGFYFRYDYFDEGRTFGKGLVGWYGVRIGDPARAAEVAQAIENEFANSAAETKAEAEGAFVQGFVQQMGDIGTILTRILSAVFFIILLVAGNTMGQAVRERTQEIGVLKALGFTNERVLVLVLAESCVLAALGGLTGLGAAWLLTAGGSPVPAMMPVFYLPTPAIVTGVGLVFALGLAAGCLPAIQAMHLQIAVALRRNG